MNSLINLEYAYKQAYMRHHHATEKGCVLDFIERDLDQARYRLELHPDHVLGSLWEIEVEALKAYSKGYDEYDRDFNRLMQEAERPLTGQDLRLAQVKILNMKRRIEKTRMEIRNTRSRNPSHIQQQQSYVRVATKKKDMLQALVDGKVPENLLIIDPTGAQSQHEENIEIIKGNVKGMVIMIAIIFVLYGLAKLFS